MEFRLKLDFFVVVYSVVFNVGLVLKDLNIFMFSDRLLNVFRRKNYTQTRQCNANVHPREI